MFEAAELGQKVEKRVFAEREPRIHTALLELQREIRVQGIPVVVIVAGAEGAGKGEVVHRLTTWLDPRGIRAHAFWDETGEEKQYPDHWRFWAALPSAGSTAVMFGSWYTHPLVDRTTDAIDDARFDRKLRWIEELERLLTDDGLLLVKFWFHLSRKEQKRRLKEEIAAGQTPSPYLVTLSEKYDRFMRHSERAIRLTDTGFAPWHLVESTDRRYRDLTVGEILLETLGERLGRSRPKHPDTPPPPPEAAAVTILDRVDLTPSLGPEEYEEQLERAQRELSSLAWQARRKHIAVVAVFEGWDASGKGGAIRRVTQAIDARLYRVVSVGPPTQEERAHHYLWRFWRDLPRRGQMTFYDRSWYGRVLVERVEGFAAEDEWRRAYQEINDFEEQLVESGMLLLKFWMHISPDEQLRRFQERERVEWKKHKITPEDWRNREKWDAYALAVNDMVSRTSTRPAPWTLVAGNDKRYARVQVLETFCSGLKGALGRKG